MTRLWTQSRRAYQFRDLCLEVTINSLVLRVFISFSLAEVRYTWSKMIFARVRNSTGVGWKLLLVRLYLFSSLVGMHLLKASWTYEMPVKSMFELPPFITWISVGLLGWLQSLCIEGIHRRYGTSIWNTIKQSIMYFWTAHQKQWAIRIHGYVTQHIYFD